MGALAEQVFRLCAAMDQLAMSMLLRLEAYRASVERQTSEVQAKDEDTDVASIEAEHCCIQYAGLIGNHLLLDRQTNEALLVFKKYTADSKARQISFDVLEQAVSEEVFDWNVDPETVQGVLSRVLDSSGVHSRASTGIGFSQFVNVRELFMKSLVKEACSDYNDRDSTLFCLLQEHARLREAIKLARESGTFGTVEVTFLFQIVAWLHAALLSQYHSGVNLTTVGTLDQIHAVFSLLPWIEVFLLIRSRGVDAYLGQGSGTTEAMYTWGTLVCLVIALVGVVALEAEAYAVMSLGTARFCMSFACMTIFTQNMRFSQMLQTLLGVSGASWPVGLSLVAVTCIYARAARDMFSDKVLNDYGSDPFFDTYGRSLSTFFRLFVAQGWTSVVCIPAH